MSSKKNRRNQSTPIADFIAKYIAGVVAGLSPSQILRTTTASSEPYFKLNSSGLILLHEALVDHISRHGVPEAIARAAAHSTKELVAANASTARSGTIVVLDKEPFIQGNKVIINYEGAL
jgi:hypothetical protein